VATLARVLAVSRLATPPVHCPPSARCSCRRRLLQRVRTVYATLINQPDLLWGLKPETDYCGLLENKHATLVLTVGAYAHNCPSPRFGVAHRST
jgi:hypothetical protein